MLINFNYLQEKIVQIFSKTIFSIKETIVSMNTKDKYATLIFTIFVFATYNIIEFMIWKNLPFYTGARITAVSGIVNQFCLLVWVGFFIFFRSKNYTTIITIAFLIFTTLILAERLNEGGIHSEVIIAYSSLAIMLAFVFAFIEQGLKNLRRFGVPAIFNSIIAIMIFIIPAFLIIYNFNVGDKLGTELVGAVMQSDMREAYEYIVSFIDLKWIFCFIAAVIIISFLFFRQARRKTQEINRVPLMLTIFLLSSIVIITSSNLRIFQDIKDKVGWFKKSQKRFYTLQKRVEKNEIKFFSVKKQQGETYVIVIGESLNKNHMGLYGYFRKTTPILSKMHKNGEIMVFKNIISSHVHTFSTLTLALTSANQYNKQKPFNSLSIINILNAANIDTYWLSNQTFNKWSDVGTTLIAMKSKKLIQMSGRFSAWDLRIQKYDGVVIDELKKILGEKNNKRNKVVFIHLNGSHSRYSFRYPKDKYSIFKKLISQGDFGKKPSKNSWWVNHYDNSVLYNDYVVSALLKELQKHKGVGGFVYFADHSEVPLLHLMRSENNFTYAMVQIPMIAWFSDEYKKKYSSKYNTLKRNVDKLYSNDMLYNTLIGMLDIQSDKYDSTYDFTSKEYGISPSDIKVLHGRKYVSSDNYTWWQQQNSKFLTKTKQATRIFPHRVNSIGKLNEVWNEGFRSFEIDVRFGDNKTKVFRVGHHKGAMGHGLEKFLSSVDYKQIKRIWVDFKNLNKKNFQAALKRLNVLDRKFNLKSKFIIESMTTKPFFKAFRRAGWHTSYYMNTGKIMRELKSKDKKKIEMLAVKIAQQIKKQKVSAISFYRPAYPFVKQYLEALIAKDIVYHIWYAPALYDENFKQKLLQDSLYLDKRIKSHLAKYKSDFSLTP